MMRINGLIARTRSLWVGVRRTEQVDEDMQAEFEHHIEMRAADLQKSGLAADDALRQARAEFGGTYNFQQQARDSRGLGWFDALRFSWLDFRLGLRMLRKYPGLTVISSLAMGVAIAIGATGATVISLIQTPALPLHDGDRVVAIQLWDREKLRADRRILHDLEDWRALRTVEDVGGFRPTVRNVVTDEGNAEMVRGVEMNAAGFRLARVSPYLGRYLTDADERPGAPAVAVIGHDVWRRRFGADSGIIGRTIRFGAEQRIVVGVMPPKFKFPVYHDLWIPPTIRASDYQRLEGPTVYAFARLAPGVTLEDAQAEVETLGARIQSENPRTHERVAPQVLPFTKAWIDLEEGEGRWAIGLARALMAFLLLVICVNIAVLIFARTATRQGEVAVRSALGASRGRIVAQLLGESLVLSVIGAIVGLAIVAAITARAGAIFDALGLLALPFWMRFEISRTTIIYLIALAAVSAVIIGVVPALRVTGRRVHLSLQRLAGGYSTIQMGRAWTALIILEVALTVAILPAALRFSAAWASAMLRGPGFAAEQYVTANIGMEALRAQSQARRTSDSVPDNRRAFSAKFAASLAEFSGRLSRDPEVIQSTLADEIPGAESPRRIEVDSLPPGLWSRAGASWLRRYPVAREGLVDANFLDFFAVPQVNGRRLTIADTGTNVVVVNRSFVDSLLGGRNAIGRRVRNVTVFRDSVQAGAWKEIVGVVEDFPTRPQFDLTRVATYEIAPQRLYPAKVIVQTRNDPAAYGPKLRKLAVDAEPTFLVVGVSTLDAQIRSSTGPLQLLVISLGAVTLSVLVLSAAGIYALMSVVVTQRRREIGIRIALGATQQRVLSSIFSRVAAQLVAGVVVGLALAAALNAGTQGEILGARSLHILVIVALFMTAVGTLAAFGPARRGLRIQPTEALKAE